jgi:hypothetical protein
MAGRPLLPKATVVSQWSWDGALDCQEHVLLKSEQPNLVFVEEDSESILFRTIKLKKAAAPAPQKLKKPTQNIMVQPDTTFLPAPIHKMSIAELKTALKSIGMSSTGSRAELEQRLDRLINGDKR